MTPSPTHDQEPTGDDVRIAVERLSRFAHGSEGAQRMLPLRMLMDHVAIVLNALSSAEEKFQWLCENVMNIGKMPDGPGFYFGMGSEPPRIYDSIDALVTAEMAKTTESTG